MTPRHPAALRRRLPTVWLMTDERMGSGLWQALRTLPRGGGVVFRHHATAPAERRRLFRRIRQIARLRNLLLVRGGDMAMPGETVRHGGGSASVLTCPAHDRREAMRAVRSGAAILFVSPVFVTRSHPSREGLGGRAAARIVRGLPVVAIALGGMDMRRFRGLHGFHGWAGIDAWLPATSPR